MALSLAFPSRYIIVIDSKLPKKALNKVVTFKFCLSFVFATGCSTRELLLLEVFLGMDGLEKNGLKSLTLKFGKIAQKY